MKPKTTAYASCLPELSKTSKYFWISQKTLVQRTVIIAAFTCKSLLVIGLYKGTTTPIVAVQESISIS